MATLLRVLLRLTMLAAGLVLAAGVSFMFLLVLALWGARAVWARLTGRAPPTFVRFRTRAPFAGMAPRAARPQPAGARSAAADVTDVEARPVGER